MICIAFIVVVDTFNPSRVITMATVKHNMPSAPAAQPVASVTVASSQRAPKLDFNH